MKKGSDINNMVTITDIREGNKKVSIESEDGFVSWLTLNQHNNVMDCYHRDLSKYKLNLINNFFKDKDVKELIFLDNSHLYNLVKKDQLKGSEEKLLLDYDKNRLPIIDEALEDLRKLSIYVRYPDTDGKFFVDDFYGDDLICRCFGISKQTVFDFLKENPESNLRDINENLSIGGGCGSCMSDTDELIDQFSLTKDPSPIEWMIYFDKNMESNGQKNWGKFLGISGANQIDVHLQSLSPEDFNQYVSKIGNSALSFSFN